MNDSPPSSSATSSVSPQDELEGVFDTILDEQDQRQMEKRLTIVFSSSPLKQFIGTQFQQDFTALIRRIYSGEEGREYNVYWRKLSNSKITALHFAARYGLTRLCQALIQEFEYNVNAADYKPGSNPLHLATSSNHISTVEALIDLGADVTSKGLLQETPLHVAVMEGYEELVRLLISRGADTEADSMKGRPLHWAAAASKHGTLKILLDNNVNSVSENCNRTALHLAVEQNSMECVKLLLEARAGARTIACGTTPLCHAASHGTAEMVRLLLRADADANAVDLYGLTPLEKAVQAFRYDVAEILLPLTRTFSELNLTQMRERMNSYSNESIYARSLGDGALKSHKYFNAIHWYTMAISVDPNDALAYFQRSMSYLRLYKGQKALSDAQQCTALKRDWAEAYYLEAMALKLLKDHRRALEALSNARRFKPDDDRINNAIRCVREEMALMNKV